MECFRRRKHGTQPVECSTWELPERTARWCLEHGGLSPDPFDTVAHSYDPQLAPPRHGRGPTEADVLVGQPSDLAALVAAARALICGDTGIGHLSTAVGAQSVLPLGSTPPA